MQGDPFSTDKLIYRGTTKRVLNTALLGIDGTTNHDGDTIQWDILGYSSQQLIGI